jgi:hypothetical protein
LKHHHPHHQSVAQVAALAVALSAVPAAAQTTGIYTYSYILHLPLLIYFSPHSLNLLTHLIFRNSLYLLFQHRHYHHCSRDRIENGSSISSLLVMLPSAPIIIEEAATATSKRSYAIGSSGSGKRIGGAEPEPLIGVSPSLPHVSQDLS